MRINNSKCTMGKRGKKTNKAEKWNKTIDLLKRVIKEQANASARTLTHAWEEMKWKEEEEEERKKKKTSSNGTQQHNKLFRIGKKKKKNFLFSLTYIYQNRVIRLAALTVCFIRLLNCAIWSAGFNSVLLCAMQTRYSSKLIFFRKRRLTVVQRKPTKRRERNTKQQKKNSHNTFAFIHFV